MELFNSASQSATARYKQHQGVNSAERNEILDNHLIKLIEENADAAIKVHLLVLAEERDFSHALVDDVQELQQVPNSTKRVALTKGRLGQGAV